MDNIHFSFSTKYDIWTIYILVFPQTNTTFSFFRHTDYYIQGNQIRHLDNIHFSFSTKYDIWTIYILVFQQTNTTFPFFDIQTTKQQKTTYCKYSATTYYYIPLYLYLFPPYLSSFTSNVDSNPFYFFLYHYVQRTWTPVLTILS